LKTRTRKTPEKIRLILEFEDNSLLPSLFGQHDQHLARLEQGLGIQVASRGNRIVLKGEDGACRQAGKVLRQLYANLEKGEPLTLGDVEGVLRLSGEPGIKMTKTGKDKSGNESSAGEPGEIMKIVTRKRVITPRTPTQNLYIKELLSADLIFAAGPAGTGKTYLAVAVAVAELITGSVDRIILSRPAVEAGESLGYLPGDMKEKVDPYLRPLYDALHDTMPAEQVAKCIETGEIEIAPVAFMRGRTLSHSYVILDEAQNSTPGQMKMFLTRLGENSRMVVTGDPSQVDLLPGVGSGLDHATGILEGVKGVAVVRFTEKDVIRNPLVRRIINAYDAPPKTKGGKN